MSDRVTTEPLRDCEHNELSAMRPVGGQNLWLCRACRLRFYPACRVCVDVGHRNVEHPAQAPQPVAGLDAACPCGHEDDEHVHYCSHGDIGSCPCDAEYVRLP